MAFVTEDGLAACRFSIGSLRECVISLHKSVSVADPSVAIGREDVAAAIAAIAAVIGPKSVKPKAVAKPSAEVRTGKTSATKMMTEPTTKTTAETAATKMASETAATKMTAETAAAKMTAPTAAAKMTAPAAAARECTGGGRYDRCAQRE
jgi:hypothetical protein